MFETGPCLALVLVDVTASGTGPEVVAGPGHLSWLTVDLAVRAGWGASEWAKRFIHPRLTFTMFRPTFAIDGVGSLYQVPLATAGLDLGCEWIL